MKVAAVSIVYNEEKLIPGCVRSLKPFVDQHIMVVSTKPYYGEPEPLDNSAKVAEDEGCEVITGAWKLDHMQRNIAIELLQDYDWILTTDVDMWMTHADGERLMNILDGATSPAYIMGQHAYWRDIDHVLVGDEFAPVIAIKPSVRFSHIGCVDVPTRLIETIKLHHINWCEPKNILKKVLTYPHAPEFDGQKWYDMYYKTWKEGNKAILPNKTFEVKYQPLPEELRAYL